LKSIYFNQNIQLNIFDNLNHLQDNVTELFISEFNKGLCVISGGNTPRKIYDKISKRDDLKTKRKILLADDRLVVNNHNLSNYGMLLNNLKIDYLEDFPISYYDELKLSNDETLHEMIESVLKENQLYSSFLGIGSDGHTASLFPKKSMFNSELSSFKIKNKFDDFERFTLSYKSLMLSKKIIFIAIGSKKNKPLLDFFNGNIDFDKYPFQMIAANHSNVKFYCDKDALKNINL
jgi:6-phosphogluconolactonase